MSDPTMAPAGPVADPSADEEAHRSLSVGLRSRKKRATWLAIHRAALELAGACGVDHVTVAQIAERAGVSTRTLFNYFPSREDALLGSDPGRIKRLCQSFLDQPAELETLAAWRSALFGYLAELAQDQELWQLRRSVAASSPQLWARMMGAGAATEQAMVEASVRRTGVDPLTDLTPVIDSYVASAAVRAAMWQHARSGSAGDLAARLDVAFARLTGAFSGTGRTDG